MTISLIRAFSAVRNLWDSEEGQDLVEYALVVALVAFGAISGMQIFSEKIGLVFTEFAGWVEGFALAPHPVGI